MCCFPHGYGFERMKGNRGFYGKQSIIIKKERTRSTDLPSDSNIGWLLEWRYKLLREVGWRFQLRQPCSKFKNWEKQTKLGAMAGNVHAPVDAFDDYDPTPFGGGYDQGVTYGKSRPPSEETCYPPSQAGDESSHDFSYGSESCPYGGAGGAHDIDEQRPTYGSGSTPSYEAEESTYGGGGGGFDYGRPKPQSQPAYGYGHEPKPQPAYGSKPNPYGDQYEEKPSWDIPHQDYQSGYSDDKYGDEDKPSFGRRPSYGQQEEETDPPRFGRPPSNYEQQEEEPPRFQRPPSYHQQEEEPPRFGRPPSYSQQEEEPPKFVRPSSYYQEEEPPKFVRPSSYYQEEEEPPKFERPPSYYQQEEEPAKSERPSYYQPDQEEGGYQRPQYGNDYEKPKHGHQHHHRKYSDE